MQLNSKTKDKIFARHMLKLSSTLQNNSQRQPMLTTIDHFTALSQNVSLNGSIVVALHIRRGDSCADPRRIRKCFDINDYETALIEMSQIYKIHSVFLSTDDSDVQQDVEFLGSKHHFEVFMQKRSVGQINFTNKSLYRTENIPAKMKRANATSVETMAYSSLFDPFALKECHAFVGTFTSDFGRIAFELMSARLGYVPPYYSLEETYCSPRHRDDRFRVSDRQVNMCH